MSKIYQLKLFQENQEKNNLRDSAEENSVSSATYLDKEHVINWVLERCIAKYFEMSLRANSKSLPSLTSRISDLPGTQSNEFFSKTEAAAMKRVSAAEWLRVFHENLDGLPTAHKEIIEEKYLQRASDGRYRSDLVVYQELNLGRTIYYQMKKEALYWLGVRLAEEKIFDHTEEIREGDY
ncbi:ArpU family phage packaging/lysis transcriptional regulator [Metasolibacillus fluoroglycofenilyticus]|uniref:ArpU family phage packaging/lysis transcriptional regulator n=1 Tax=Metasolibacillus fluoroglycofenilyticus TaxID=1239396 RepID=UPI000D354991|nr:ArpU family phage packaging/lysis transcriptional regulator [Metasolibacillus fluoroglycofenilyticus]